ncbi:MAG: pyrroline-5-carboxylate reductase [Actinomycetales bacterium]|nr:pyrroline-5-carboxylate reductase [Actinomycetales bacterium]
MEQRTAVLGGGVMGGTLVASIVASGNQNVVVIEKNAERAAELARDYGVEVGTELGLIAGAQQILLAVKPQDMPGLLSQIAPHVGPSAIVISLAAGVTTETIEGVLGSEAAVVRVMPNTPAIVGEGMFGVSAGTSVSAAQLDQVVNLLAHGGKVEVIDEPLQNALTSVSGSGPAYVFYLAENMIEAGVAEGLDREVARSLTAQTLVGAAKLLAESPEEPAELRRRVTSPNGATFAATQVFDEAGVDEALIRGIRAAAHRSAELG